MLIRYVACWSVVCERARARTRARLFSELKKTGSGRARARSRTTLQQATYLFFD